MADDEQVYSVEYLDGNREQLQFISRPGVLRVKYENGDVFEGSYTKSNDGTLVRQGQGKYAFATGAVFEGQYTGGKKNGRGSYTYSNGDVYDGLWANNVKNGAGTYMYVNGDTFSGNYAANKKHGHGAYVYKSTGAQLVGEWMEGSFVKGKWLFPGGSSYHGTFKNGQPVGKGVFYYQNGLEQSGEYDAAPADADDDADEGAPAGGTFTTSDLRESIADIREVAQPPLSDNNKAHVLERQPKQRPPFGVIISGAPASGKGTQCEMIREEFGLVHLSTGDMLRAAVAAGSELGMKAKELMESGQLVPDDVVIGAVKERLSQSDVQEHGFLLDGFPRTAGQAQALSDEGIAVHAFLMLNCHEELLIERVVGRRIDPETGNSYHVVFNPPPEEIADRVIQRADDTVEKVKVRLEAFHANIDSIKDFYTEVTHEVDGAQGKEVTWAEVKDAIQSKKEQCGYAN